MGNPMAAEEEGNQEEEIPDDSPEAATTLPQDSEEPVPSDVFIDSIGELKSLSDAISAFQERYDDLQNHLQSIKAAISEKLPENKMPPPHSNQSCSEIEDLCKSMSSRGVRKYLSAHLSDLDKVRGEFPKALLLSADPAQLVLESLGKFYLQGKKAFTKDSPMIPARKTSIFILECFLLMIGMNPDGGAVHIKPSVKAEAEAAAMAWRKRLVAEGGLDQACEADARGLLMFVACFGIPAAFKREDMRDLVINANAKEMRDALRNSDALMDKILEVVDDLLKSKKEVDAVDIVYTFGLEERYNPQAILVTFLRESKESGKMLMKILQGSATANIEAKRKQLSSLTALVKCLKKHNVDASKLIPGWQIRDSIANLERDIANAVENQTKRKEVSRSPNNQQAKRSRYTIHRAAAAAANAGSFENLRSFLEDGHQTLPSPPVVYGGPAPPPPPPGAGLVAIPPPYGSSYPVVVPHPYPPVDPAIRPSYIYGESSATEELREGSVSDPYRYRHTFDGFVKEGYMAAAAGVDSSIPAHHFS